MKEPCQMYNSLKKTSYRIHGPKLRIIWRRRRYRIKGREEVLLVTAQNLRLLLLLLRGRRHRRRRAIAGPSSGGLKPTVGSCRPISTQGGRRRVSNRR